MDAPIEPKKVVRDRRLDVIRLAAIVLVLFWHSPVPHATAWLPRALEYPGVRFGWAGVDVFFVLSGFLVGGLLMKRYAQDGSLKTGRFLTRRAWKIVPQLYLFLALMTLTHRDQIREWIPAWVTLQNYLGAPAQHLWSLAVEEHFYLSLALLLPLAFASRRMTPAALGRIALGLAVFCLLSRTLSVALHASHEIVMLGSHNRIDALFFGVFLASVFHLDGPLWQRISKRRPALLATLAVGVAILCTVDKYSPFMLTVGLTTDFLAFGALLVLVLSLREPTGPLLPLYAACAWIGERSYGIYVWQFFGGSRLESRAAAWCAAHHLGETASWAVRSVGWFGGAILAGIVSFYLIELPPLRLRERLFPSRLASPSPAVP